MMPWGHFFVAVIPFVAYTLTRHQKIPSGSVILALGFGTQFPDLVDKPLAWRFDVLANGRMFMHSLVFAVPLSIAVLCLAWEYDRKAIGGAFVFGYLLHLPGDFYSALIGREPSIPNDMLWPLFPPTPMSKPEFVAQPGMITFSMWDIAAVGFGTVLLGYTLVTIITAIRRYDPPLQII